MRRFFRNRNFLIGFVISSTIVAGALISLCYTPYDPTTMDIQHRLEGPSHTHWLGTDHYGRDVFSRIMQGAVNSIIVGLVAVSIGMGFGVFLGSIAGYNRGIADEVIMRLSDLLYGFPAVLSAILVTSVFGPGIVISMMAIGIFYIPIFARLTRASSLSVWERDYITAARAGGRTDLSTMVRHVLPNIMAPLIVQGTIQFAVAILAEAGLSSNIHGHLTRTGSLSRTGHCTGRSGVQSSGRRAQGHPGSEIDPGEEIDLDNVPNSANDERRS